MSKSSIIALTLGITSIIGVCAYIAYDTNQQRDIVTLARGADIPARSPETVSPFGDPATAPAQASATETDTINGIPVPPMPNKTANDATVAGIDVNTNGVRDDIERLVAEEFGDDKVLYQAVLQHERLLQQGLVAPTEEHAVAFAKSLACFPDLSKISDSRTAKSIINTRARSESATKLMHATEYYAKCSMYQ